MAGSRVTLESIVSLFDGGATAEEIVQSFPTLGLPDVYATLDFVLRRRESVDAYLERRRGEDEESSKEVERRSPQGELRRRLEARRQGRGG